MMARLFWPITAFFIGVVVHLSYVLFAPSILFQRSLASLTNNAAANTFFVMAPEAQVKLVPGASAQDIVGLCLLDLSAGKITFAANVPKSLWTIAIFSQSGQQVYSINDVEAGTSQFSIELKRAKGILQQLTGKSDQQEEAGQIQNVGWHAEMNDRRGVVVLWVPIEDLAKRASMELALKSTKCEVKN
jgi:uncharacterized membrane protein